MNFKVKRRLTYGAIAIYFMCGGVEYGVVFPTIWSFLQHLGARDETFLGLAIASFSMSGIIIGPLAGKWFDKTHNAKAALLVANMFGIGGSVMYFAASSPWFVVLSRFVCGVGSGAGAVILADISLSTVVEGRTSILSRLSACRQVGLMTGPAFNLILQQFHFEIFDMPVNPMTSPGLFMATLGILLECVVMFSYFNLGSLNEQEKLAESLRYSYLDADGADVERASFPRHPSRERVSINREHTNSIVIQEEEENPVANGFDTVSAVKMQRRIMSDVRRTSDTNGMIESADDFIANSFHNRNSVTMRTPIDNVLGEQQSYSCESLPANAETTFKPSPGGQSRLQELFEEFIRHEVVAVLGLSFISYFAQTSFETIVTPLTQDLYNFGASENSLLFLACGLEILLAYLTIAWFSKHVEDRLMMLIGMIFLTFALSWFLYFVPRAVPGDWSSIYYFAVGLFFDLLAICMLLAGGVSLFSKLISKERQGLGQGLRRSCGFAGTILGPLWAGGMLRRPTILFAVPLVLVVAMLMLFLLSYPSLRAPIVDSTSKEEPEVVDERTPLIDRMR